MTTTNTEALACELEKQRVSNWVHSTGAPPIICGTKPDPLCQQAAAELRRLSAENEALQRKLQEQALVYLTRDGECMELEAELASTKKALALVQQHHATAWNRGHEAGMRASRDTVKQATDAVKRDAWGNTQLTEALLAVEAERDALRADAERWRFLLAQPYEFWKRLGFIGCWEDQNAAIDAAMKGTQ